MAYQEPMMIVECDKCGYSDSFDLTPLAGGGWDARNVNDRLDDYGWVGSWDDEELICDECSKKEETEE